MEAAQVFGQEGDAAAEESDVPLAPVAIDGETLFSVRGVTAHPAEVRAGQIEDRIRLAADSKIQTSSVTTEDHPGATWILVGGQRVMAVLDEDAAVEDLARPMLAELYKGRIAESIEAYRQRRGTGVLWLDALYALGMTLALLIAAALGRRFVIMLRTGLKNRYGTRMEAIEGKAHSIIRVEQVWRALAGLLNIAWGVGIAVMVYAYLSHVLGLFPWTRGLAKSLFAIAVDPLQTMGQGLLGMIPKLAFLAVLVVITRYALKLMRIVFERIADGTFTLKGFDPEWAPPTYRLLRILVIAFAVVVAYPYIPGSGSEAFKGISLLVGIIFSLGSSSFIGNLTAGYSMTYRRAFRPGDLVKIGEQMGKVEQVRMMVTHLRTIKNEEVIVPNSVIIGAEVTNYSSMAKERGLILHTKVGIRYEIPWRQVEAMLLEAAERTPGLSREPVPFVLPKELGDFYVSYELNVFCDTPNYMQKLYGELHRNILDVFNEYGVQIMTPAYEGDPDQPKIVPRERWYAAPAHEAGVAATTASDKAPTKTGAENQPDLTMA